MTDFRRTGSCRAGAKTVPTATLNRAEKRLVFGLPLAFREWLQLPSNPYFLKPKLFWTQQIWPRELEVWPEKAKKNGLVVFKREYQNCAEWAFRVADAHLDDPPVYVGGTDEPAMKPADWQLQSDTFSEFMLHLLMVRSVDFASKFHACKDKATAADWKRVGKRFTDIGFLPWLEYGKECRLFGGPDCLLLTRSNPPWGSAKDLTLNARTAAARELVTEATGITWGHVQDIK